MKTNWPQGSQPFKLLEQLDERTGASEALTEISRAERVANAKAARLLAARECPADLLEWGRIHGIPTFAEVTWQAGFLAGMRAAELASEQKP